MTRYTLYCKLSGSLPTVVLGAWPRSVGLGGNACAYACARCKFKAVNLWIYQPSFHRDHEGAGPWAWFLQDRKV